MSRILVPVRFSAWLTGGLGQVLEETLRGALVDLPGAGVTRLPRGFLVDFEECEGPAVECVARAVGTLEDAVAKQYPVFHAEMGPVWTGSLQVIYKDVKA
jgi:hypothetical protein